MSWCGNTDFTVTPPPEIDKTWTIIKTTWALIVKCNGVVVLDYVLCDQWSGDKAYLVVFEGADTASLFYRVGEKTSPGSGICIRFHLNHKLL